MRPHELPEGIGLAEKDIGEKGLETAKHPRWDRPYRGAGVHRPLDWVAAMQ